MFNPLQLKKESFVFTMKHFRLKLILLKLFVMTPKQFAVIKYTNNLFTLEARLFRGLQNNLINRFWNYKQHCRNCKKICIRNKFGGTDISICMLRESHKLNFG